MDRTAVSRSSRRDRRRSRSQAWPRVAAAARHHDRGAASLLCSGRMGFVAAPLGGIERSGWNLAYQPTPNAYLKDFEKVRRGAELGYSIGLRLNEDGRVADVVEGMAAAKAGLGPGMKVLAVNGKAYSADILREAIKKTADSRHRRLDLTIDNEGHMENHQLTYAEGEKYPVLQRDETKADILTKIIAPLTWSR